MSDLRRYGARSFSSAPDGFDRWRRAAKAARSVPLFVLFLVFVADTVGTFGFQRMTPKLCIVAMGDSTTAGTPGWKSPIEAPPNGAGDETSQYAYWLMQAHPEWEVLNRGVNGERSDQILARFERDVIAEKPAAVVIIAGVNDVYQGRPADFVTANLRKMYERATQAHIRVVAGTIVPYNSATPDQNARMHAINDWIREQAVRDANIALADTRAAVSDPGSPDRLSESPDGLHPTAEGYRRMAEAVRRVLEVAARDAGR